MKKCLKLICLIIMTLFLVGWKGNEKYEITIDKNETVSINYILGYDKDYYDILFENMGLTEYDDEILWNFIESANNHLDMDPRDNGYVLERYDDGTYKGLSYNKTYDNILPLVDNNASISGDILTTEYLKLFTYKNNTYNLNLRLVKSDTSAPMTATFVVSLPNKSESHNATTVSQDGRTLTWDLYETSSIDLSFKINPIPWNSILIGGGIGIALVFLLMALSYMKKKGKIDVKHMPKGVAGASNVVDIPNNNVDNSKVINNQNDNVSVESLETLNINEKVVDSLNTPVGNTEDVESLAMVDTFKETKSPVDKDNPTHPQFSFDNPNNNAAADYTQGNKTDNENNNSK